MSPTGSGYGTPPPTPTHHLSPPAASAEVSLLLTLSASSRRGAPFRRAAATPVAPCRSSGHARHGHPRDAGLSLPCRRATNPDARGGRSVPGGSSVLPLALRPPRSGRLRPPPCSMALRARSTAHRADDQESCRRSTVDRPDRCFHLNRWLLVRHLIFPLP